MKPSSAKNKGRLLQLGVAKEQARTILPLNLETTFIWTGSLLAYINFWKLRITRDTQFETIIQANRGDLMGTVRSFAEALQGLDQFSRQQALQLA